MIFSTYTGYSNYVLGNISPNLAVGTKYVVAVRFGAGVTGFCCRNVWTVNTALNPATMSYKASQTRLRLNDLNTGDAVVCTRGSRPRHRTALLRHRAHGRPRGHHDADVANEVVRLVAHDSFLRRRLRPTAGSPCKGVMETLSPDVWQELVSVTPTRTRRPHGGVWQSDADPGAQRTVSASASAATARSRWERCAVRGARPWSGRC